MLFDEQVGFVDLVAFGRAFQLDTAADNGAVVENRADVEPDFRIRRRKGGSRLINLLDTAVLNSERAGHVAADGNTDRNGLVLGTGSIGQHQAGGRHERSRKKQRLFHLWNPSLDRKSAV